MTRKLLLAAPLLALLVVLSPAATQAGEPVTAATPLDRVEGAVKDVLTQVETWPAIPNYPTYLVAPASDGTEVRLGLAKAYHKDTEYGHVDVVLLNAFGSAQYQTARLVFSEERLIYALRAPDGSLFVPAGFSLHLTVDPSAAVAEVASLTFDYTLKDGSKSSVTYKPAK
jgi:hypothetical protein